ncbi:MAG: mechanosensitive ion channel family protein [Candidatus Manganitrophaceae bacterium]
MTNELFQKIVSPSVGHPISWAIGIFIGVTAVTLIARSIFLRLLHRWAEKTETEFDNLLISALRLPSINWAVAIGLYAAIGTSSLPAQYVAYSFKAIHALVILSVTLVLANISSRLVSYSIQKMAISVPLTGLSQAIIKGTVLVIGFLILLGTLGISITPLITALGVGGLAVALALQDTLSNLFAGIHILVEQPFRVGDFIRLETGQEGYVTDIGWRTTRIRMLPNNMVIIPNNKLSQSILTNYYLPDKQMALLIPISVSYDTDPDHVERVLIEEATQGVREIPGLLADPAPMVRFIPGFGDFSLNFTLICQVREFTDQYLAQHELRKRILKRLRKERIEIPFPVRTIYMREADVKD